MSEGLKIAPKMVSMKSFKKDYLINVIYYEGEDWFCGQDIMNLVNESVGTINHKQIKRDVSPENRRSIGSMGLCSKWMEDGWFLSSNSYFLNELGVYQLLIQRRRRNKAAIVSGWFANFMSARKRADNDDNNRNDEDETMQNFI